LKTYSQFILFNFDVHQNQSFMKLSKIVNYLGCCAGSSVFSPAMNFLVCGISITSSLLLQALSFSASFSSSGRNAAAAAVRTTNAAPTKGK
jgi:hypothetical protein